MSLAKYIESIHPSYCLLINIPYTPFFHLTSGGEYTIYLYDSSSSAVCTRVPKLLRDKGKALNNRRKHHR